MTAAKLFIENYSVIQDIKEAYERGRNDYFNYVAKRIEAYLQDGN